MSKDNSEFDNILEKYKSPSTSQNDGEDDVPSDDVVDVQAASSALVNKLVDKSEVLLTERKSDGVVRRGTYIPPFDNSEAGGVADYLLTPNGTLTIGKDVIPILSGLTVFPAPTRWGKTTLLSRMVLNDSDEISFSVNDGSTPLFINNAEPLSRDFFRYASAMNVSDVNDLEAIIERESRPGRVILIDSIRDMVYAKSVGGTGEGGIDMFLPILITKLNNYLVMKQCSVICTINPMLRMNSTDQRDKYESLIERLTASTAMVIAGTDPRRYELTDRTGTIRTNSGVIPDLNKNQSSSRHSSFVDGTTQVKISDNEEFETALSLGLRK